MMNKTQEGLFRGSRSARKRSKTPKKPAEAFLERLPHPLAGNVRAGVRTQPNRREI